MNISSAKFFSKVMIALVLIALPYSHLDAQKSRKISALIQNEPVIDSLGIQVGGAYGHNAITGLDPWRGFILSGGFIININLFRWNWMKLGLGLTANGEFYRLPVGQKPYYLSKDGYLTLFSLRLENKWSFFPADFLYFGPGALLSLSPTGVLGDKERGEIRYYSAFFVPYISFHLGYKHRRPIFKNFRWAIETDIKVTLNNESRFELGGRFMLTYQFKSKSLIPRNLNQARARRKK